MSEDLTLLQLQEARRALALCTGERDRAREEARQLRVQLRSLRAELLAVRPVEQSELLAAQEAQQQALAQAKAAKEQALQAQAERDEALTKAGRAEVRTKQARMESDMSLERVIELREQLARLRANRAIDDAAVALLRAQLDATRAEAPLPSEPEPEPVKEPGAATEPEPGTEPKAPASPPEATPEPSEAELAQVEPEAPAPNTEFDLPEGAIWEFEGAAEPEHFMKICLELCGRAAGTYLRIGHFEGKKKGTEWNLVVMAGPEHSVRDFLVALHREHMRLMSATGLPLVRVQPTRWSANVLNASYEEVAPLRYSRLQALVVDGTLVQQEGGQ
jgi:hypothetical protein